MDGWKIVYNSQMSMIEHSLLFVLLLVTFNYPYKFVIEAYKLIILVPILIPFHIATELMKSIAGTSRFVFSLSVQDNHI